MEHIRQRLTVSVAIDVAQQTKQIADKQGKYLSRYVESALLEYNNTQETNHAN